jgi:CelD/BcsL family acetyltransferase involved in cellulose biosynthesis
MNTESDPLLSLRVIRAAEELASVRDAWHALATHPFTDFDYFQRVLARDPAFVRPHVLVIEREGRVVALLAAHLRRETIRWRIGSFTIGRTRARVLQVGSGGVMGEDSPALAQTLTSELLAALARGEADAAYLHQVDPTSALGLAFGQAPRLARDRGSRPSAGWLLELPASHAAYLASRTKSVRRHLKRYAQVLERELGTELEVVCHRDERALESLMRDSESVARLTYHRGMQVGFEDTPAMRQLCAFALAAGWMRGYVMRARGKPIAFWHGLVYRGTLFSRDTGYDPAFAALRPGQYLLHKLIEEQCRTREVERFDYGVMELDYKKNFGTRRYERQSLYLFSLRPKGLLLSSLRTGTALAERLTRRLLGSRARTWGRRLANLGRRRPAATDPGGDSEEEPKPSAVQA